jgi:HAAS domain-containing protein
MAEPGVIAEYLDRLASELDFDRSLSRCVRREVEDHLWEAVSADPAADRLEAERRAVTKFGDPHAIAMQFAVIALARRARRVGLASLLVTAGVFIAMKARLAWYATMERPVAGMGALGQIVVSIDHYAFWLAVLAGLAGWVYIDRRRVPAAFTAGYRAELRRFALLSLAATGALVASVIGDGILTSLRLVGACWSVDVLMPLASMAVEVAAASGLVASLRGMMQRTAATGRASRMG